MYKYLYFLYNHNLKKYVYLSPIENAKIQIKLACLIFTQRLLHGEKG